MSDHAPSPASSSNSACDLCHSRKVKCDRREPCQNCVLARVECQRTRTKRTPRPKIRTEEKIQALVERLSSLEDTFTTRAERPFLAPAAADDVSKDANTSPSTARDSESASAGPQNATQSTSLHGTKRKREVCTPDSDDPPPRTTEARLFIQRELSDNRAIPNDRRSVLEAALSFINELSQPHNSVITEDDDWDEGLPGPEYPPAELIHMILGARPKGNEIICGIEFPDHIPPATLERMGLALLDRSVTGQTLLQYKVILYYKAVLYYSNLSPYGHNKRLYEHAEALRVQYGACAMANLNAMNFLAPPSLSLLQALISGSVLMQIRGDATRCWTLTGFCTRVLVALGYHNLTSTVPQAEKDYDIHACLAFCFQLDKQMSILHLRPQSLPPLHVRPTELLHVDDSNPMKEFARLVVQTSEAQEIALNLIASPGAKDKQAFMASMNRIREMMSDCRASIGSALSPTHPHMGLEMVAHWLTLEFSYHSILTTIFRLCPSLTTDLTAQQECLDSARNALLSLKKLQDHLAGYQMFAKVYQFYISWTVLSYPLTPFFVLFCNVVANSNMQDFELIQNITDGLSHIMKSNEAIARLYQICAKFVSLCKPLAESMSVRNPGQISSNHTTPPGSDPRVQVNGHSSSVANGSVYPNIDNTVPNVTPMSTSEANNLQWIGVPAIPSDSSRSVQAPVYDDLMWQLFDAQPNMDWFHAEVLNAQNNFL